MSDDDANYHEFSSSSTRCMTATGPEDYSPDDCSVLEPIILPPADEVEMDTISIVTHRGNINQTCAKIISACKTQLRCTVIVDCLTNMTDGRCGLIGRKKHNRFLRVRGRRRRRAETDYGCHG